MSLQLRGPDRHQKLLVHTDQVLGSGALSKVVKATLDQQHPCAAKIILPEHVDSFFPILSSKVEQAYQIWRDLNHPNIVQILGMVKDHRNNTPIILMELMEQSLTHFLERSSTDIHYHMQVNISNDIAQAVDHLHRNGIIHGDLTSNNILLSAHYQAKLTGFKKSITVDSSEPSLLFLIIPPLKRTFLTPPEALTSNPCYSHKSDCFSVGILLLRIATRLNPSRLDLFIDYEAIIQEVPAFHGFLPVIRDCLKDKSEDRPSAAQLCQRLGQLKTTAAYRKSLTDPSFQVRT